MYMFAGGGGCAQGYSVSVVGRVAAAVLALQPPSPGLPSNAGQHGDQHRITLKILSCPVLSCNNQVDGFPHAQH
jgi:hypothetical protein